MENTTVTEGKTIAIISYLWIIGLIIAFVMNNDKKNSFASFHIRQMVGLALLSIAVGFVRYYLDFGIIGWVLSLGVFALWIIGFIGAVQGEEKRVPLLGDQFQEWFKGIG